MPAVNCSNAFRRKYNYTLRYKNTENLPSGFKNRKRFLPQFSEGKSFLPALAIAAAFTVIFPLLRPNTHDHKFITFI